MPRPMIRPFGDFAPLSSRTQRLAATLFLLSPIVVGCTSISSRLIERDCTNTAWQSEGHLKGIPITLKVPTHLKLYVYDVHYLEYVNNDTQNTVRPVDLDVPVRDFASEFMYTDKIFTVDFKRPAGGPFNLRLGMTEDQYFRQIQHDVTDQTISQVSGLIGNLFAGGTVFKAAGGTTGRPPVVSEVKSLAAVGVFEISSPTFQADVCSFLNCHLNKAHDAWVAPPGVDYVNRVGISPGDNLHVPYPAMPFCPGGDCGCPPNAASAAPSFAPNSAPWGGLVPPGFAAEPTPAPAPTTGLPRAPRMNY